VFTGLLILQTVANALILTVPPPWIISWLELYPLPFLFRTFLVVLALLNAAVLLLLEQCISAVCRSPQLSTSMQVLDE